MTDHIYMPKPTRGRQSPPVSSLPETGGGIEGEMPTFKCPLWPGCDCPGGTVRPECPGLKERQSGGEHVLSSDLGTYGGSRCA